MISLLVMLLRLVVAAAVLVLVAWKAWPLLAVFIIVLVIVGMFR